ncbi:MAG: hypothetical protein QGG36_30835 [Pirellulaceae bacterium]|nr:hypothetical protein [Pirellulaceae bacterium]
MSSARAASYVELGAIVSLAAMHASVWPVVSESRSSFWGDAIYHALPFAQLATLAMLAALTTGWRQYLCTMLLLAVSLTFVGRPDPLLIYATGVFVYAIALGIRLATSVRLNYVSLAPSPRSGSTSYSLRTTVILLAIAPPLLWLGTRWRFDFSNALSIPENVSYPIMGVAHAIAAVAPLLTLRRPAWFAWALYAPILALAAIAPTTLLHRDSDLPIVAAWITSSSLIIVASLFWMQLWGVQLARRRDRSSAKSPAVHPLHHQLDVGINLATPRGFSDGN